jgi:diacylglycerol kinase family enzyme
MPGALINDGLLQLRIFTGDEILPALFTTLTQPEDNPHIIDGKSAWFEVSARTISPLTWTASH